MSTQLYNDNIAYIGAEPERIITPDPAQIFLRRSKRFEKLAHSHALSDWLLFLSRLSQAQHRALQTFPHVPLPDQSSLHRRNGMPPLPALHWQRDAAWREVALTTILNEVETSLPDAGREQLEFLRDMSPAQLESLADRVVNNLYDEAESAAILPLLAAALQVYWTHMASALGSEHLSPLSDTPGVCPCCGSLPVASIVRTDGAVTGLRYLHCSLCNTEWNLVRVKCTACDSTRGIAYHHIEGKREPISAETCDNCDSYLKIAYASQDAEVDPVADDLATLSLDILVDEAGYSRSGPNLLLVPGQESLN